MALSFTVTENEMWTAYVQRSFDFDFYHSWAYHAMDKRGTPLLFVFEDGDQFIALPLLKRKIDGTGLFDLTSVYGYTGPLSNKPFDDLDEATLQGFRTAFRDFVANEKIVSLFSRLNPFFKQVKLLQDLGGIRPNGRTVFMDLSEPLENQREKYDKRLHRQIRQLRKQDFPMKETESVEDIKVFTEMYLENMDRVSALPGYYYNAEFFTRIIHTKEFSCKLILLYDGTEIMCGAIITCSKYIIRNHLSATNSSYIKGSPSKLLTDEISLMGRKMGMKYFHMGGGVGGRDDSLLAFKSRFSPLYLDDHIWCYVPDEEIYQDLVERSGNSGKDGYFPLYRNTYHTMPLQATSAPAVLT